VKHQWYVGSGGDLIASLWVANALKVALLKPTYVPDYDAHRQWSHISGSEITGPGYTAGGQALANKTKSYDAAGDRWNLLADDSIWSGATFQTAFAAIYDPAGSGPLWSLVDFEGTKDVAGGVFTIDWAAIGALYVTKA
jgi:hypothetical protein